MYPKYNNKKEKEKCRPISLMKIDAKKFSIKYLQTGFNNTLKRLYTMFNLVSFQRYKDGSAYTNQ
jgi:hypothetical protein